jgi:hypothetical protein
LQGKAASSQLCTTNSECNYRPQRTQLPMVLLCRLIAAQTAQSSLMAACPPTAAEKPTSREVRDGPIADIAKCGIRVRFGPDSVEKLSFPFRRATLIHQRQSRGPQRFKMTSGSDQTLRYRSTSPAFSTESAKERT